MSRYRIVIQPRARIDTIEGFSWIAERSEDAAIRWYAGLQAAIAKLGDNPERNPVAVEESRAVRGHHQAESLWAAAGRLSHPLQRRTGYHFDPRHPPQFPGYD